MENPRSVNTHCSASDGTTDHAPRGLAAAAHALLARRWLVAIALCLATGPALRAAAPPTRSTPDLFVDMARDAALRCRGRQTEADLLAVRTLLRAAVRLDPGNARGWRWLYDLAQRSGPPASAAHALARLVEADPTNTAALARWLEVGPPEVQTAEQWQRWLEKLLARFDQPQSRALIHTRMAALALEQADRDSARKHLAEAHRLWPHCPQAALLRVDLLSADDPPARRLSVLFDALTLHTLNADLAWQAALVLDETGFAQDARTLFRYAMDLRRVLGDHRPLTPEQALQLARNQLALGELNEASHLAQKAALAERKRQGTYEAAFFWYWILQRQKAPESFLKQVRQPMANQFAAIKDPQRWPVALVAQAAWYYCTIEPQPERALLLAKNAAARAPDDPFVQRVLGWAEYQAGDRKTAQETLIPLVTRDPYATALVARMLRDAGDAGAPARLIAALEHLPPAGRARALLDELAPAVTSRPADQRHAEMVPVLKAFPSEVLQFVATPTHTLRAAIRFEDPSLRPGQPWWMVFSLTNTGAFPISLGTRRMLNPVFLLSYSLEDETRHDFPNLLPVALDTALVIEPGQTLQRRQTIDVGPPRAATRRTPQHLQSISVTAVLDPRLSAEGRWVPGPTGQVLRPAMAARRPANTSPEAWHARFAALRGDVPEARYAALEEMAELLGEAQRARLGKLDYRPEPVPIARIRTALVAVLQSASWEARARTLAALDNAGLDRSLLDAARGCLKHPHWAVRLLAVRTLARQGRAFVNEARQIAHDDPHELVRNIAQSYVLRWTSPAPASTQPGRQAPSSTTGKTNAATNRQPRP